MFLLLVPCFAVFFFFCFRRPLEELEEISCTETKCIWKERKSEATNKYKPQPLTDSECFAAKAKAKKNSSNLLSEDELNMIRNDALVALPNCAFSLHL